MRGILFRWFNPPPCPQPEPYHLPWAARQAGVGRVLDAFFHTTLPKAWSSGMQLVYYQGVVAGMVLATMFILAISLGIGFGRALIERRHK